MRKPSTLLFLIWTAFALFFLTALPPRIASALVVPEKPLGYVSDFAQLLTPEATNQLEIKLRSFETQTSNQVVVAIFDSLEGESLEEFSIRLAEKWKIGQKDKNNGVLLLVFKKDRKLRIEVGYGLEGALPDGLAKQIIDLEITPSFKQGDFKGGLEKGLDAIFKATQGEYRPSFSSHSTSSPVAPINWNGVIEISIFVILIFAIDALVKRRAQKNGNFRNRRGDSGNQREWTASSSSWGSGSSWGSSSSGSSYGSSSGSSFSSGGGSFGGGGSSGSW